MHNIELPNQPSTNKTKQSRAILEIASTFFQSQLHTIEHYLEQRDIQPQTAQEWQLGYAPDDWQMLTTYLSEHNIDMQEAQRLGVIREKKETGRQYDVFRHRLVFPIHNQMGKLIGFAGRTLGAGQADPGKAKYINSAEGPLYQKSKIIYGLDKAAKAIKETNEVQVTEGYIDAVIAHQHNIHNMVATGGTAFTRSHAQLLKRYTNNITLIFDGDHGGYKGTVGAARQAYQEGMAPSIIQLPKGTDIDDLLKEQGSIPNQKKDIVHYILDARRNILEFYDNQATPDNKLAVLDELASFFLTENDLARQLTWLEYAAKQLDLPFESALLRTHQSIKQKTKQIQPGFQSIEDAANIFLIELMCHDPDYTTPLRIQIQDNAPVFTKEQQAILKYINGEYVGVRTPLIGANNSEQLDMFAKGTKQEVIEECISHLAQQNLNIPPDMIMLLGRKTHMGIETAADILKSTIHKNGIDLTIMNMERAFQSGDQGALSEWVQQLTNKLQMD